MLNDLVRECLLLIEQAYDWRDNNGKIISHFFKPEFIEFLLNDTDAPCKFEVELDEPVVIENKERSLPLQPNVPGVILFSGGIDSFIGWGYLSYPKAIHVNLNYFYSAKELKAVKELDQICYMGVIYEDCDIMKFYTEGWHDTIPLRNLLLTAIGSFHCDKIFLISQKGETSIKDRTPEFFDITSKEFSRFYGTNIEVGTVLPVTKAQLVKWYIKNDFEIEFLKHTVGCFSNENGHCGACPACLLDRHENKVWVLRNKEGNKLPSEVKIGDTLIGWDGEEFKPTIVKEVFERTVSSYLVISLTDDSNKYDRNKRLFVTHEHPFYVIGKGWIPAKDIQLGDTVAKASQLIYNQLRMKIFNPVKTHPEKNIFKNPDWQKEQAEKRKGKPNPKASIRMVLNNPMKNLETRKKVSKTLHKKYEKGLIINSLKGQPNIKQRERWLENNPMKNSEIAKRVGKKSGETRKLRGSTKGDKNVAKRPDVREKIRTFHSKPEVREAHRQQALKNLPKILKALHKRPTSLEQYYIECFKTIPEVVYTGDGSFPIGGNIFPDFKLTGQNKVIEVYEQIPWRSVSYEEERKKQLEKFGYDVIFFKGRIPSEDVVRRTREFLMNGYIVESIEEVKGLAKVFNYHCEPHNNFVVGGALVHNCFRRWIALEYAGIKCLDWFNRDLRKWEGIRNYVEKMKKGMYDDDRTLETIFVLDKYGLWR